MHVSGGARARTHTLPLSLILEITALPHKMLYDLSGEIGSLYSVRQQEDVLL